MNKKEIRMLDMNFVEEDDKMIIEGYAVVFDSPATHYGHTEIIDRHALDNCDMSDVCLKYNHADTVLILARTRNNSLKLIVDEIGLKIRAELIDTTTNIDVYKMIKAGLIDKMSFAFTALRDVEDYETNTRRILEIDKLFDVSVVDVPFYDGTQISARNIEQFIKEFEERKANYMANKLDLAKRKLKMKLSLK